MYNSEEEVLNFLLAVFVSQICIAQQPVEDDAFFESSVRPLLAERCVHQCQLAVECPFVQQIVREGCDGEEFEHTSHSCYVSV